MGDWVTRLFSSEQIVKYLLLDHSQRLTGELLVDETVTVKAFVWFFEVKSVLNNMTVLATDPKVHWRWYCFPPSGRSFWGWTDGRRHFR